MAAGYVSMKYGFQGTDHAAVTACATIGDGARMIQFGDVNVLVAGGNRIERRCFVHSRIFIGEGSGILVLEDLEHAMKRGAKTYAEVRGYEMSGDAHHITQPHGEGRGAVLAMSRVLKQEELDLADGLQPQPSVRTIGANVERKYFDLGGKSWRA